MEENELVRINKYFSEIGYCSRREADRLVEQKRVTKKCYVEQISKYTFRIILTQGLNRQIRRMCEHLGNRVVKLERYRIMNVDLDIPIGKWRYLTKKELDEIFRLVKHSSKTTLM